MPDSTNLNLDYERPIRIAEDIYWVGFYDKQTGLHCNPYLIVDGAEAVVIDGGSRPDFSVVMMKILQTGISPDSIKALIYQHYDPDLCGSIPNFEDLIDTDDLIIISEINSIFFIRHYSVSSPLIDIHKINYSYEFSSGRKLEFILTPYAHSPGSFMTFDSKTGVLFTSDLFGSYSLDWELFLELSEECKTCSDYSSCPKGYNYCSLPDILKFHQMVMTSGKALHFALDAIEKVPSKIIAPQHGSVITHDDTIKTISDKLKSLQKVGIDGIVTE